MNDNILPSDELFRIGDPVEPDDIDSRIRLHDAEDRRYIIRTVVDSWDRQQTQDRNMRRGYARYFLLIISAQILAINAYAFLIGFGVIQESPLISRVLFIPAFVEIATMTLVILRYLFPPVSSELFGLLNRLYIHRDNRNIENG